MRPCGSLNLQKELVHLFIFPTENHKEILTESYKIQEHASEGKLFLYEKVTRFSAFKFSYNSNVRHDFS